MFSPFKSDNIPSDGLNLQGQVNTTPDLAGHDIDISRFIREESDHDVQVLWRDLSDFTAIDDEPAAQSMELCPVSISEFKVFSKRILGTKRSKMTQPLGPYRWDFLESQWVRIRVEEIIPGNIFLLATKAGGYSERAGWDSHETASVVSTYPTPEERAAETSSEDDALSGSALWQSIREHTDEGFDILELILASLHFTGDQPQFSALRCASRWHDRGKAHPAFLAKLRPGVLDSEDAKSGLVGEFPAKAPNNCWRRDRCRPKFDPADGRKRHFRNELASALAVLQAPEELVPDDQRDLVAYLVAAHHGKVRCSIRSLAGEYIPEDGRRFARGVWEGDELPETILADDYVAPRLSLSLAPMELGEIDSRASWVQRTNCLLECGEIGPFRLGYLEALLRAADRRASATCGPNGGKRG